MSNNVAVEKLGHSINTLQSILGSISEILSTAMESIPCVGDEYDKGDRACRLIAAAERLCDLCKVEANELEQIERLIRGELGIGH